MPRSSTRRTASVSSARGQSLCSSGGGPGSTMTGVPLASTTRPGAVPASPSTSAPSGTVACFVTPCAKSAYGRFIRSAAIRETPSICASSSSSDPKRPARDLGDDLDRPVVVRRAEAAGARDEIGRGDRVAHGSLELRGVVADDLDPCGLEPECQQRASEERAVEIGPLTAHELAARDDDHGPWARCRLGQAGAWLNSRRRRRSSSQSRRRPAP